MWGGSSSELGDFPNSFNDFLKVVIAADGDKGENVHMQMHLVIILEFGISF